MVKSLLVGLNVFGILLLSFFQKEDIEITQEIPQSLNPGQEEVITVTINKSDVSGFAKFQITVGDGLVIEPIESAGASFTFNNQKAKFIWMALPASKEFTLKYRLIAKEDVNGIYNLSSRFSYIYESERKNYDALEHDVTVGSAPVAAVEESTEEETADNAQASVNIYRNITLVGVNQWKVNVEMSKEQLEGFGKIEERIPDGYIAIDLKASSAIFSIEDDLVKYIWYDIPQNDKITVTYKLLPVIAMVEMEPEIEGTFTYLREDENIVVPIGSEAPSITEEEEMFAEEKPAEMDTLMESEVAMETPPVEEEIDSEEAPVIPVETPAEEAVEEEEVAEVTPAVKPESKKETKPETSKKGNVDGNIVNVPQPETGVFYRVQIAAGHNNLKRETFSKLYSFTEDLKLEAIGGWIKYTTGHHQVYKSARDDRERINTEYQKFQGPFVTDYNDGERITVQEALMITNQKWFQ